MRYGGVRALSGTISIGTPHNGSDSDDEMDDTGDNHDEGVGMMMLSAKSILGKSPNTLWCIGACRDKANPFWPYCKNTLFETNVAAQAISGWIGLEISGWGGGKYRAA